jgi:hypothetical protein
MMDEMKWNGMGWEANDSIDWMINGWATKDKEYV